MIMRAVFWVAVVAILMPHEPDLGLGRPGIAGVLARTADNAPMALDCGNNAKACSAALGFLDSFQAVAVKNLAEVKADIEQEQRSTIHRRIRAD